MKVLFLDIDGVLNSQESVKEFGTYQTLIPSTLKLLKHISDGGVKIVLSSSWRKFHPKNEIEKIIGVPIHDATPVLNYGTRGHEIQTWLDRNRVQRFAIVDDDKDMLPEQMPFFVRTNILFGMQHADYVKLCSILGILP